MAGTRIDLGNGKVRYRFDYKGDMTKVDNTIDAAAKYLYSQDNSGAYSSLTVEQKITLINDRVRKFIFDLAKAQNRSDLVALDAASQATFEGNLALED